MVIGIDIDDTITETSLNSKKYLKLYDANYTDYHDLPKERYEEFFHLYIDQIMQSNPLKEGVKEAFLELKKLGYKIILITARNNVYSPNVIDISNKYLKEKGLVFDEVIYDEADTDKKGPITMNMHVTLFIDDKESVLDEVSAYGIKCIRFTKDHSKYKTFSNWHDIIKYIRDEGYNG